jgi:hypothetical protein
MKLQQRYIFYILSSFFLTIFNSSPRHPSPFSIQNSERGAIALGLISQRKFKGTPLGKKEGFGLRNDGRLLSSGSPGGVEWSLARPWGTAGETIGCGYLPQTKEIFFTQGNKFCGIAFKLTPPVSEPRTLSLTSQLLASVSLCLSVAPSLRATMT